MGKPAFVFTFILYAILAGVRSEDAFYEELYIKSMEKGNVLNHFQFTTVWNSSISDDETFQHYRLFPKALGDVLSRYKVQELHLSQTQGLWKHEHWGYPPEDTPPGVELWVWFQPNYGSIDQVWAELVNALSGLFCASLNFMDSKATVIPRWSFRPMGLASEYYSFDSRFMRYSALPKEIVCTENLTPWEKLLPCESQAGLAGLFNAMKLYDASFHSLGLHVRPVCQDRDCKLAGIELKQTLTVVFNPSSSNRGSLSGYQNWSIKSMFGRSIHEACPMSSFSKVYVDTTLHKQMLLSPEPDEVVNIKRGGEKRMYNVYDVKKHAAKGKIFNLQGSYNAKVKYGEIIPPPLYAQRFVTGYGLEKGGITTILHNSLDTNLTVIYMETIPWYLRVYFSSIRIEAYKIQTKPYKTHFIPGKDRSRPSQLELVFRLRPLSVTKITMEFERAFLKWTEYPPDANHGFYVNSAVISTVLPSGQQYTAVPQNASTFRESLKDESSQFFLRIHTESLLVSLPTPDFSMPYNVICLACTVVAIAFGSLHNLTTRRFVVMDPNKKIDNPLQKLKKLFSRKKESETREEEKDDSETKENEDKTKNNKDSLSEGNDSESDKKRDGSKKTKVKAKGKDGGGKT
ncbi:GPI transamidase component PIG-T-like [Mercenaria mercenaria]|uniref:GPI transamidase component PIG-T-like n=1 Tax=Mercenaria mercenaria TaxID=6596 RepID=UPI00234F0D51|nr:GPI transamidase component PIG-T-like [Mercenaria mercenaria]